MGHCWTMISIELVHSRPPYSPFGIRSDNKSAREIFGGSIKAPVRISSALVGRGVVPGCHSGDRGGAGIAHFATFGLSWSDEPRRRIAAIN